MAPWLHDEEVVSEEDYDYYEGGEQEEEKQTGASPLLAGPQSAQRRNSGSTIAPEMDFKESTTMADEKAAKSKIEAVEKELRLLVLDAKTLETKHNLLVEHEKGQDLLLAHILEEEENEEEKADLTREITN